MIDRVVLQERIEKGEYSGTFTCEVSECDYRVFQLYKGNTVGHKPICRFSLVHATCLIIEINEQDGEAELNVISGCFVREHLK